MPKLIASPIPRILLYDIETAPYKIWAWELFEANAIAVIQPWYMISFAWKWMGDKKIRSFALPQFKDYRKNKTDDRALCQALWKLMDEADVCIAHNASGFDNKKSFARFVKHNFQPPAPFKTVDTLQVAKNTFRFGSNSLDSLGDYLGVGRKRRVTKDLWFDCIEEDKRKAWKDLRFYNERDVELLEKVYLKLRPWIKNHPNYNLLAGTVNRCTNCGSHGLIVRGYFNTLGGPRQKLQCTACGHYSNRPFKKPDQIVRQM